MAKLTKVSSTEDHVFTLHSPAVCPLPIPLKSEARRQNDPGTGMQDMGQHPGCIESQPWGGHSILIPLQRTRDNHENSNIRGEKERGTQTGDKPPS